MGAGAVSTRRKTFKAASLLLRCFQAYPALQPRAEPRFPTRIDLMSVRKGQTMRWKISHNGHDPRQIDLLAALALLIVIVTAWHYFYGRPEPPSSTAFIVPSQSVRW
jgi:hypothetical protein